MMSDQELPGAAGNNSQPDYNSLAYVLAAAIIIGGALIAGSVLYSTKLFLQHADDAASVSQTATQPTAQAPSAPQQPTVPSQPTGPVNIKLAGNVPYLGSGSAKVTVVEFADYECPFCERWYTTVMPDLKSKYIDTGKIKFVYQDFAFLGPDSNTLAEGSHCAADQNKFWQYHDYIFSHQGQENSGWGTPDKVKALAAAMGGLNLNQFNQCLDSGKYKQEVLNETSAGKTYGVSGTPTVFINGTAIVGAQPASTFTAAIDAALAK